MPRRYPPKVKHSSDPWAAKHPGKTDAFSPTEVIFEGISVGGSILMVSISVFTLLGGAVITLLTAIFQQIGLELEKTYFPSVDKAEQKKQARKYQKKPLATAVDDDCLVRVNQHGDRIKYPIGLFTTVRVQVKVPSSAKSKALEVRKQRRG